MQLPITAKRLLAAVGIAAACMTGTATAQSAFTYQGVLEEGGSPVTGLENIRFRLFDAPTGGSLFGETTQNVDVEDGVFSAEINFGPLNTIDPNSAWLEVAVNTGPGTFETLGRQRITSAPFSTNTRGMNVQPSGQVSFKTNSPSNGTMFVENTSATGFAGTYFVGPGGGLDGYVGVTSGGPGTWIGGDGMQIGSVTGQDVIVTTGAAERMRVLASGNVGIGTTSPEEALQVGSFLTNEDQFIQVSTNGGNNFRSGIRLSHFASDNGFEIFSDERGSSPRGLHFTDLTGAITTTPMFIQADSGNVGIGNTNPNFPMTIESDPAGNTIGLRSNTGGSDWHMDFTGDGLSFVETGVASQVTLRDGGRMDVPGRARFGTQFGAISATTQIFGRNSETFAMVVGDPSGIFRFSVNNNGDVATQCGVICASDERLKDDITNLETPLDKIMALRSVSFSWKDETLAKRGTQLGFVAQEVQQVLPELIGETPDGMLGVDYASLTSVLTGAVQEQQAEIERMRAQIAAIEAQMESMQTQRSMVGASMVWPALLGGGALGGLALVRRRQMKDVAKN
ncbi:MAG: tail fiber domain-containing protein [Planctomycetota bacterium]